MTPELPVSSKRRVPIGWLVASAVLLALTALLLRNWLRGGLPTSGRQEVLTELSIVWMFKQELLQGHLLSEWNPYWFSGFPWLRFLSYPIYYVAAGLSAWGHLRLETVLVLFYVVVLAGSGLAMFAYLQEVLGDWRAALVGAVIYESFPFHNYVGVETWIHAAFWVVLPLPLWFIERSRARAGARTREEKLGRIHYLMLAGVALGLFPIVSSEYAILAAPFVVFYLFLRGLHDWRQRRLTFGQMLGGFLLVGLISVGLAIFFLLPGLLEVQYVGIHSKHGGATTFTDQLLSDYAVTPGMVWYSIARRLRLAASDAGLPGLLRSFSSLTWYPGVIASLLVALGLTAVRRHFVAAASLLGLLLTLLLATGPTFQLNFFNALPVLGRLSPFRGLLVADAFAAILAGWGARWLLQQPLLKRRFWQHWLPGVLVGGTLLLIVLDFWPSAAAYQTTDAYFDADEQAAYAWLAGQKEEGRLWDVANAPRDMYLRTYSLDRVALLRHFGYYDNGAPLYTWQQIAWTDLRTVLKLHQVRYVLLRAQEEGADQIQTQLEAAGYRVAFASNGVQVWQTLNAMEYARVYNRSVLDVTQDFRHPFQALPEFVRRNIAMVTPGSFYLDDYTASELQRYDYLLADELVAHDPAALDAFRSELSYKVLRADDLVGVEEATPVNATVWSERRGYETIYLDVSSAEGGVLSIAESWYPHWRVRVDGQPREVLRVNWALLGTWLEPGEHRVEFYYERPWYVYLSYGITLVTLLALVLWWTWYWGLILKRRQMIDWEGLEGQLPPSLQGREA